MPSQHAKHAQSSRRTATQDGTKPQTAAAMQYLSTEDVAIAIGCCRETVQRWIRRGELAARDIGTPAKPRWRVAQADLDIFMAGFPLVGGSR